MSVQAKKRSGKKTLTKTRVLLLSLVLVLFSFKLISCDSSSLGCGEDSGMATLPYGAFPLGEKIINLGQVRVTQSGVNYIEQNAMPLVETILASQGMDGLCFPLPEGDIALGCSYCPGGCNICLDITNVVLTPLHPDKIEAKIYLSSNTVINIPTSGGFSCLGCNGATVDFRGAPLEVKVLVLTRIDPDTRFLDLVVQEPTLNWDQVNISLQGTCGLLNGLVDTIIGFVTPTIRSMVKDLVTELIEDFKCVKCEDAPCPDPYGDGVSCDENSICRKPNNDCLIAPLGIEAEVDVGALIADMFPGLSSKIWASVAAGGRAEMIDNGIEIGVFGGTMIPEGGADSCVEEVEFPVYPLDRIDVGNTNDHLNPILPYHAGIGLREELLDQAGYTLQNSGLLCLTIDDTMPSVGEYLSMGTFGLLLPSIKKYTHGKDVPASIQLEPGEPIDFAIHDGAELFPNTPGVDIGLKVKLKDLKLNIYGLCDERMLRLFTLQVDADVSAGIQNDTIAITPVLSLDNVELSNFRVPYSILAKDPVATAESLEGMIGGLLGQIPLDPFDPIEIPGIDLDSDDVYDMFIQLQMLAAEEPKNDGTGEHKALYVYAELFQPPRRSMGDQGLGDEMRFFTDTSADITELYNPSAEEFQAGARPYLRLKLSGTDADGRSDSLLYSFRLDGKGWTPWTKDKNPTIDAKWLMWQGEHKLEVRSRDMQNPRSADPTPAVLLFDTDFLAPNLRLMRQNDEIHFKGGDNVTPLSELEYRYRANDGAWAKWSGESSVSLAKFSDFPVKLEVEVRDRIGHTARMERTYESITAVVVAKKTAAANQTEQEAQNGCQAVDGQASVLLSALFLLGLLLLRRMKPSKAAMGRLMPMLLMAVSFSFISTACDNASSSSVCQSWKDCDPGYDCINGACVLPGDDDINSGELPDSNITEPDGDDDVEASDDTEEPVGQACEEHEDCTEPCTYCSGRTNTCEKQRCDPECADIPDCGEQLGDTCALCVTDSPIHMCEIPRCESDDDCGCKTCPTDDPAISPDPVCKPSGLCECVSICYGSCPGPNPEGTNLEFCCTKDVPEGMCIAGPTWCEGVTCEPGFAPGQCPAGATECEYNGEMWHQWDNYNPETCQFEGPGIAGHPSCECFELPPLPMGFHGRFNDVAIYDNDKVWLATYNETYGDLMVGSSSVAQIDAALSANTKPDLHWAFIDGVPEDAEIEAGPSGPRGGIGAKGDDVGKYTSIGVGLDGMPRIAYQDVDNGDLIFLYALAPEGATGDEPLETLEWVKIVVDATGDTGYYADMWIDPEGRPIITYMMVSNEAGNQSALKLAMANSATPTAAGDFTIVTVDSSSIGDPCAADPDGCVIRDLAPYGTGLNPTILVHPSPQFEIFYYWNTHYQNGENVKVGSLMSAKMNGLPDPATLSGDDFTTVAFMGGDGTPVPDDVGIYSSAFVIESTGWYAVAFYNQTLNQLQIAYDFKDGRGVQVITADDGWRRDNHGDWYQVMLGADCNLTLNNIGYFMVLYQDMTQSKLMYYQGNCQMGNCTDEMVEELLGMDTSTNREGMAVTHGYSYGFFSTQALVAGLRSIVATYAVDVNPNDATPNDALELKIIKVPPEMR